jgi:hypothetical protein
MVADRWIAFDEFSNSVCLKVVTCGSTRQLKGATGMAAIVKTLVMDSS